MLGFVEEEEDEEEGDDVEAGVEAEDAGGGEGGEHAGEGDGEDGAPEVCGLLMMGWGLEGREQGGLLFVATAQDMPTSRWLRGNTSAL